MRLTRNEPDEPNPHAAAPPPEDAGSQALAEALRSSFFIVKIIMVVLVLVFLGSGFFTVGAAGQGDHFAPGQAGGRRREGAAEAGLALGFPASD